MRHASGSSTLRRPGFSLVEMVVAVMLVGIIAGLVVPAFGRMQSRQQLTNARDAFVFLAARARSDATAMGETAYMELDVDLDRAWIRTESDTLYRLAFGEDYDVDVASSVNPLEVCYTSRGLALPSCMSDEVDPPYTIQFIRGPDTATAVVEALGSVRAQ